MTSDTHTRYGSRVRRHGNSRAFSRYHCSSARRSPFHPVMSGESSMSDPALNRRRFLEMIQRPDAEIDLARAALIVAAEIDPTLDVDVEMARLDRWAAELSRRIDPQWNSLQRL